MKGEKRERLASLQHNIWTHWMQYLFSKCVRLRSGLMIPTDKVTRWQRQMRTLYKDLPEEEKESDRHQADKVLKLLSKLESEGSDEE